MPPRQASLVAVLVLHDGTSQFSSSTSVSGFDSAPGQASLVVVLEVVFYASQGARQAAAAGACAVAIRILICICIYVCIYIYIYICTYYIYIYIHIYV